MLSLKAEKYCPRHVSFVTKETVQFKNIFETEEKAEPIEPAGIFLKIQKKYEEMKEEEEEQIESKWSLKKIVGPDIICLTLL